MPRLELGAGEALPTQGTVFLSTHDRDKQALVPIARSADRTRVRCDGHIRHGSGARQRGIEGAIGAQGARGRPNIEDQIRSNQVQLVINTPIGRQAAHDDKYLRSGSARLRPFQR